MRKPSASVARRTAAGGAAPAVITSTGRGSLAPLASAPSTTKFSTVGAQHMCVTSCRDIASKMVSAAALRRQTCVPAAAATAHAKHQPLQWNIGSVQINRGAADAERQELAQRIQVGAAMMVH